MKKRIKCISCKKYFKNKSKTRYALFCRTCFRKRRNEWTKKWKKRNKSKIREYKEREYVKEKAKEYSKLYRKEHPEQVKECNKKYYQKPENKKRRADYEKTYQKTYRKKNRDKLTRQSKERYHKDPNFRISRIIRNRLRLVFRKYIKTGKTATSKECGINYKLIIEQLKPFPKDLSNYHIDHIRPLCSFNFVNEDNSTNFEEVKKAFAPENHQWLTIQENMSKGNKWK